MSDQRTKGNRRMPPPKEKPVVEAPEPADPTEGLNTTLRKKFDQLVREKVACGLPKADAEEVARRQIDEDKAAAGK